MVTAAEPPARRTEVAGRLLLSGAPPEVVKRGVAGGGGKKMVQPAHRLSPARREKAGPRNATKCQAQDGHWRPSRMLQPGKHEDCRASRPLTSVSAHVWAFLSRLWRERRVLVPVTVCNVVYTIEKGAEE
ncbi:hypothetical protein J1605_006317 [Eschrichtius robustus]|uniref:Uncharacterized protein n=1 Tax=Eschrichtius robustus TaxID=9764 RepID=A0AB34H4I1_ESCRO|nr:hypothetical protein J1605_010666 [Eschrichtius robustus]KAJ8786342.1 hypothetical protein J1605_006317 [Eschrichtius robustus]